MNQFFLIHFKTKLYRIEMNTKKFSFINQYWMWLNHAKLKKL
jgi:hypothetical protein